jgi:hypothetical protein
MSENREKRERKATVDVYVVDSPTKKEFVIPEGSGTKLGDIPNGPRALDPRSLGGRLKNERAVFRGSPPRRPVSLRSGFRAE